MPDFHTPIEKPKPWKEFRTRCRRPSSVPFYFIEWSCACGAYWLSRWSFLHLLEYAGGLSILVAAIFWITEAPERTQQRHFQAWMVINSAQGKRGNGGRIEALEELAADKQNLIGVDISDGDMQGLNLDNTDLSRADFHAADLRHASLRKAKLPFANFHSANLRNADLTGADLTDADFQDADLTDTNLTNAIVTNANFTDALLSPIEAPRLKANGAIIGK